MVDILDDEPRVIETDLTLAAYGDSLLIDGDRTSGQKQIDQRGPVQVWRILGQTNHIVVINLHADCDDGHDEEIAYVTGRLEPGWRCFAIAYNPEQGWDIHHYEPAEDARPL